MIGKRKIYLLVALLSVLYACKNNKNIHTDFHFITSSKLQDYNSFDMPDKIKPAVFKNFKRTDDKVIVSLPPFSVVVLELK